MSRNESRGTSTPPWLHAQCYTTTTTKKVSSEHPCQLFKKIPCTNTRRISLPFFRFTFFTHTYFTSSAGKLADWHSSLKLCTVKKDANVPSDLHAHLNPNNSHLEHTDTFVQQFVAHARPAMYTQHCQLQLLCVELHAVATIVRKVYACSPCQGSTASCATHLQYSFSSSRCCGAKRS